MGIPMLKIRRMWDRLILSMGIPILVRRHLYIETPPDSYKYTHLSKTLKCAWLLWYTPLPNSLYRLLAKKAWKFRITHPLWEGGFPSERDSGAETFRAFCMKPPLLTPQPPLLTPNNLFVIYIYIERISYNSIHYISYNLTIAYIISRDHTSKWSTCIV